MTWWPFGALFRSVTIGAEDISQNPSQSLLAALGGVPSASGVNVSETTAEAIPTVYACNRVLSETVAQLPLKVFRRLADGGKEPDPDHPLYVVLHDLANPELTAFEFRETMQTSLNYWGNAYAEIVRDGRGQVQSLWPLDPSRMQVDRDGLLRLVYRYRLPDGSERVWTFQANNPPILHIRINALDGIHGRSPIRVLRESLGLTMAAQQFGSRFFGNSARPGGVLTMPGTLSDDAAQRLKAQWEAVHRGPDQAHRVAVLEGGLTWTPIGIPPEDAQFLETRKFQRNEICGAFRVPPHMVADLERSTFSNVEHMAIEFVQHCLLPHLCRWQQAIQRDLLNQVSFNTHAAIFLVDGLLRGDTASRYAAYATARQNGWLSANDIRRKEDENLLSEEDGGDLYLVNGAMTPISVPAVTSAPPPPPEPPPAPPAEEPEQVM